MMLLFALGSFDRFKVSGRVGGLAFVWIPAFAGMTNGDGNGMRDSSADLGMTMAGALAASFGGLGWLPVRLSTG